MVGSTPACILIDPQHCANTGELCAAALTCDPCTPSNVMPKGCVDAGSVRDLDPNTPGCQSAEGGSTVDPTVGEEDASTVSSSTTMTTTIDLDTTETQGNTVSTATTGPAPLCDEPDGTFGGMCTGTTPFCIGGECMPCSMKEPLATCAEDPELVCDPSGACVVCSVEDASACGGATPVCDAETNLCIPCTEHAQCGEAACNLFTGACVEGMVVTVGVGQMETTITAAMAAITPGGGGTIIVHSGTYNEDVTVMGGPIVAFLANPGDRPTWQRTMGTNAPQLRVSAGSTAFVDGIDLRSNPAPGDPALRVDAASLWVDRAIIAQNSSVAVLADTSAELVVRNCFIAGVNDLPALNALTGSTVTIEHTTLGAAFGTATAISCDGTSSVSVTDSILLSRGASEIDCGMLTLDRSAANSVRPGDNIAVGATMTTWFTNYNNGDFHLSGSGTNLFMDVAEWNLGDATVDIDRMARTQVEGTPEHAGADLP